MTNREQAEALETGEIAVGLAWLPFDRAMPGILPLMEDRFCVALPNDHALAGQERLSVSMLRGQPMVYGCRTPAIGERILRLLGGTTPAYRVADLRTAIDGVAAGMGLTIVPACMSPLHTDHVTVRQLECDERLTIGAVTMSDAPHGVLGDFLDCATTFAGRN